MVGEDGDMRKINDFQLQACSSNGKQSELNVFLIKDGVRPLGGTCLGNLEQTT